MDELPKNLNPEELRTIIFQLNMRIANLTFALEQIHKRIRRALSDDEETAEANEQALRGARERNQESSL